MRDNTEQCYKWIVPFRGAAFIVITTAVLTGPTPARLRGVGTCELGGVLATGIALWQEMKKQEGIMRSKWIEYKGKKVFYQDFSKLYYNSAAVKAELAEAQQIVTGQPLDSVLVLSDFRDTNVGSNLLPSMNAASAVTKASVRKTAVLGVSGVKRKLADLLTALTGQPLKYFDDLESAQHWLAEE